MGGQIITHRAIDRLEADMLAAYPVVEFPTTHRFVPGLYVRETFLPAGTMLTSMEHKTEHVFVISKGSVEVASENEGAVTYVAPYTGITKPGTRRILRPLEDTIWTTFHVTSLTDVEAIAEEILEPHVNPLLSSEETNQWRDQLPNKEVACLGSR